MTLSAHRFVFFAVRIMIPRPQAGGRMLLVSAVVVVAVLVAGMMYFQEMESEIASVVRRGYVFLLFGAFGILPPL